jgi:hypothetical protein
VKESRPTTVCYGTLHRASAFEGFFGMTYAKENEHEIWNMGCKTLYGAGSLTTVGSQI